MFGEVKIERKIMRKEKDKKDCIKLILVMDVRGKIEMKKTKL